ncbi:hypothetical protein [Streptomyces parvulus]|uniref:hypothetical protein n=1 Tax=Streptomyces parvulus TaxID=146923 RepID=UPI003807FDE4
MKDVDWFQNTRFVPEIARARVQNALRNYFLSLEECSRSIGLREANIYVSGSLARREPSVTLSASSGEYLLHSDVDLIAVVKDNSPLNPVHKLAALMLEKESDFATTLFIVEEGSLSNFRSCVAHDVWSFLSDPLVRTWDIDIPAARPIVSRELYEVFIHQLNAYLLYPHGEAKGDSKHYRPDPSVHRLKTLLESLRLLVGGIEGKAPRYGQILEKHHLHRFKGIVPEVHARLIVRSRENYAPDAVADLDVHGVARGCLQRFFGVADDIELLEVLGKTFSGHHDVMNTFQYCVSLYLLLRHGSSETREDSAEHLWRALTEINTEQLTDGRAAVEQLVADGPSALLDQEAMAVSKVVADLVELRKDYYHHLGAHNFGRNPNLQYLPLDSEMSSDVSFVD